MKSRLFIATALTALCLASYHASAQRCLPRQMGLQLIGGPINGLLIRDKYKAYRFFGEFAMSRYNRNRSRWIIGLTYLQKDFRYKSIPVPKAQFTLDVGYYLPLVADRKHNIILSAGIGPTLGYEMTN